VLSLCKECIEEEEEEADLKAQKEKEKENPSTSPSTTCGKCNERFTPKKSPEVGWFKEFCGDCNAVSKNVLVNDRGKKKLIAQNTEKALDNEETHIQEVAARKDPIPFEIKRSSIPVIYFPF